MEEGVCLRMFGYIVDEGGREGRRLGLGGGGGVCWGWVGWDGRCARCIVQIFGSSYRIGNDPR